MISVVNNNGNKVSLKVLQFSDGWWSFPDLNTLDSDVLVAALTLQDSHSTNSVWNPGKSTKSGGHVTASSHRQMEALFNLSQLFFALCRGDNSAKTFRDLQMDAPGHLIWNNAPLNKEQKSKIDFFGAFRNLVSDIVEHDGLEVIFMMFKKPIFPLVRQKCLDILTCILMIPDVALRVLRTEESFLRKIMILIRDHNFIESKIPAVSVLLRLSEVIVDYSLVSQYMHIVEMQFIDFTLDILNNYTFQNDDGLQYFLKFEALVLQNCTCLLSDEKLAERWSDIAQERLTNYCVKQMHLCVTEDPALTLKQNSGPLNHILRAEAKRLQHGLCYTITAFTALAKSNVHIAEFYRKNRYFPHLLSLIARKYGPNSPTFPLYADVTRAVNSLVKQLFPSWLNHPQLSQLFLDQKYYHCANPECRKTHSNVRKFHQCQRCQKLLYCSTFCRNRHMKQHLRTCKALKNNEELFIDGPPNSQPKDNPFLATSDSSVDNIKNGGPHIPGPKAVKNFSKIVASTPPCKKNILVSSSSCFTDSSLINCKESPIKTHVSFQHSNQHFDSQLPQVPFSFDTVRYEDSDGQCLANTAHLTRISPVYKLCNTAQDSKSGDSLINSDIIINECDGLPFNKVTGDVENNLQTNDFSYGRNCFSLESLAKPTVKHRSIHDIRNKLKRCVIS